MSNFENGINSLRYKRSSEMQNKNKESMNSFEVRIEASRQKRLKEMKLKDEAKKTDVFADVLGFIFQIAGVGFLIWFIIKLFEIIK